MHTTDLREAEDGVAISLVVVVALHLVAAVVFRASAIGGRESAVGGRASAIGGRASAIGGRERHPRGTREGRNG